MSPYHVASRWLRASHDECSPMGTTYAWLSPDGEWHEVSRGTHDDWADEHVRNDPDLLEDFEPRIGEGSRVLQRNGWVRVLNVYFWEVWDLKHITPPVERAMLGLLLQCVRKSPPADPETAMVFVGEEKTRKIHEHSVADFARLVGGRQGEEALFGALSRSG